MSEKNCRILKFILDIHPVQVYIGEIDAGWSSLVARRAHNPKVRGSNPLPATKKNMGNSLYKKG